MSEQPTRLALTLISGLSAAIMREQRARGLSQTQTAEQIGVPKSVLSVLLRGADVKVSTVIKCLRWLDSTAPLDPPDTLTRAARAVFDMLSDARQLGQAWLRVESGAYGLLVPDGEGTLGELSRVRGLVWRTWAELEAAGLVRRGLPTIVPTARGPRNRNPRNEGWPVEIVTAPRPSDSVMLDTTTERN